MNAKAICCSFVVLLMAPLSLAKETPTAASLQRGIPSDAHLAVYWQKNPERADQEKYLAQVWQTFQEEKIVERFFETLTSRVPEAKLEEARSAWDEVQTALEPVNCDALLQTEEIAYAQAMETPFTHHLLLIRLTASEAEQFQRGIEQFFDLLARWSDGKVSKATEQAGEASLVKLQLPREVPFQPTLVRSGDVVIFSTSNSLASQSARLLVDDQAVSKFDDPRLVEALNALPAAEDAVVFFDGRLMFEKLHGLGDFLRQQSPAGNEELERWVRVLEHILGEVGILDYEVTVEYTEGQQIRVAVLGKLLPDVEDSLLYQAAAQGQPFEDWQNWVPADAEAYSLSTGCNLHVVYERVMKFVREEFPESHAALDRFEAKQQELGFHLDRDLLQSFSGEVVSVTVPIEETDGTRNQRSVKALRCSNPEKIRELLNRGIDALAELPPVEAQQIKFVDCEDLEGFQELQGTILGMFSIRPVVGYHDGWMMISSSPAAVAKIIAAREGKAPTISQADSFRKFDLESTGPVRAVSYTDVGASVRQLANTINQIGAISPIIIGMVATEANPQDVRTIQEVVSLLPSISKVVRKFDFIEHQLTVTRDGPQTSTYRRESVWLIRAAEEDKSK